MALTKIDDRGLKTPVDLLDNEKIRFGTGNDLEIYHGGSDSFIKDGGTGSLKIGSSAIWLQAADYSESMASFTPNGAVELYYDNAKKFETFSWGVQNYGNVACRDNDKHIIGDNSDLQIYHDGSNSKILNTTGYLLVSTSSGILYLDGNSTYIRSGDGGEVQAKFIDDGAVELYYDNSKKFNTYSGGVQVTGLKVLDSDKLKIGNAEDLQIFHSGGENFIRGNASASPLYIDCCQNLHIRHLDTNGSNAETMIKAVGDGAVELYHDNSLKLHTSSDGVTAVGYINNQHLRGGSGDMYVGNAAQGDLYIYVQDNTNNSIILQANTGEKYLEATMGGAVDLYHHGVKKFETHSAGCKVSAGNLYLDRDNAKLVLGASDDLQIYHDGTSSRIHNLTGNLTIKSDNILGLYTYTGTEAMAKFNANGAVELYYDNSKKLNTASDGIDVLGDVDIAAGAIFLEDNYKLHCGTGNDLQIYHSGSNALITNSTGDVYNRSANFLFQNVAGTENKAIFLDNGAVELYYDNSKKFNTNSAGVAVHGDISLGTDNYQIKFGTSDDLKIYHSGSHSFIDHTGTGNIHIRGNGTNATKLQAKQGEDSLTCLPDGAVELYHNSNKKLETQSTGVKVYGDLEVTGSGGGKLIGYSNTNDTTARTFSADTWTDCGLSITYTPQKASSKILLTAYLNLWGGSQQASNVTNDGRFNFRILEGSNVVGEDQRVDFGKGVNSTYLHYATVKEWQFTLFAQYSNSNTNAKTFKVQLYEDSGELKQNTNNGLSHFTVMEIDA